VLKARVDQDWRVALLWEGRIKELLFTLGASLDLKKREQIFRSVGLELQYSS
jgi:distribution and morphology protein 10